MAEQEITSFVDKIRAKGYINQYVAAAKSEDLGTNKTGEQIAIGFIDPLDAPVIVVTLPKKEWLLLAEKITKEYK